MSSPVAALAGLKPDLDLEAELSMARLRARVSGEASQAQVPLGRFAVLACLGRGGMGKVFEARDRKSGTRVALKTLREPPGKALQHLQREFRLLAELSHPGLVVMHELHVERGLPFFTMELVDGVPLRRYLTTSEGGGPVVDEAFLREYLTQMMDVLTAMHGRGTVHGDIKPSNILVRTDGRFVLVDFGIARTLGDPHPASGSGTPAYMAPERSSQRSMGPASDWYAIGAILRQLVDGAGEGPFIDSARRLCSGLLTPDPRARFGAQEVVAALGMPAPTHVSLHPDDDDVFVARQAELNSLHTALAHIREGTVVCTVEGDPGTGKTALLEHFLGSRDVPRLVVLAGRCHEQEVVCYKGLDGVVDALGRYLGGLSQAERASLIPDDVSALGQVFPVFRQPHLLARAWVRPQGDPRGIRRAAFSTLTQVFGRTAARCRLVLWLDDLQWGDNDGGAMLEHLLLGPTPPPLLLVASYRRDGSGRCLTAIRAAAQRLRHVGVTLEPLEPAACADLAKRLSGRDLSDDARHMLVRDSGGNPLLLRALLKTNYAVSNANPARTFRSVVEAMLQKCGPKSGDLFWLSVLSGRPVEPVLLQAATDADDDLWNSIARLRTMRLLRTVTRDGEVALLPHHDRVREVALEALCDEQRRLYHRRLAMAADAIGMDDAEFLADQHFRAGDLASAALHAERAADDARETTALQRACELYTRTLECLAPERPVRIIEKLADAAACVGDVAQAAPLYREACHMKATGSGRLRHRAALMYLQCGASDEGNRLLRSAMREASIWLPKTKAGAIALSAASLARIHFNIRTFTMGAQERPDPRVEIAFSTGHTVFMFNPVECAALLLSGSARALRHGSPGQRGIALATIALTHTAANIGSEAKQDAMVSEAYTLSGEDSDARAMVLCNHALVLFDRGRCDEAMAVLETAGAWVVDMRLDDQWLLGPIRVMMSLLCVLSGDFGKLRTLAPIAEQEAAELGNQALVAYLRGAQGWADLALGDLEPLRAFCADATREWKSERSSSILGFAMWGEYHRRLYMGEAHAAHALMREQTPSFVRSGLDRVQPWASTLAYTRACVELSCSTRHGDTHWRAAVAQVRRLEKQRVAWATAYAALVRGGFERREGRPGAAVGHYTVAHEHFERSGQRGHAAAAAYRVAELEGSFTRPEDSATWFASASVAEPHKWTRMYAP